MDPLAQSGPADRPPVAGAEISARRQEASDALVRRVDAAVGFVIRHWLAILNAIVAIFVTLPLLAPVFLWLGWNTPALIIYSAYSVVCHQLPGRSFFLFGDSAVHSAEELSAFMTSANPRSFWGTLETGFKTAFCQRDIAIYSSVLLGGLIFAVMRRRWRPIPLWLFALFALPMAIDGFTQLPGWRESTWELRVITGGIFGLAAVRFVYPYFERAMRQARAEQMAER